MTNTNTVPATLTDAALVEALTCGMPGLERRAAILLDVPAAHRAIFTAEAHFLGNVRNGGRPSDDLRLAVRHGLGGLTSPLAQGMAAALA